ncbi:holin [Brevibacillus choshinensis]|uniref:Holin n=1 Tax=Brevibacillus choshinensis TaxID=54911 RepID=A0ABR5N3C1_BRECH|nr:LrgB family protein [Brevibacillus choshinensis]KQL44976.1 holin [Brevibacillus choshinensis]
MILWKICSLLVTVLFFVLAKKLSRKRPGLLFSPAIVAPLGIMLLLIVTGTPFQKYQEGTNFMNEMLGVVTVAFAIPLYRNWAILVSHWRMIVSSLAVGTLIAILAGVSTSMLLGLGKEAAISVIPRSITLPIAVGLSESIGGIPSMTALFVMLTSFAGVFWGPTLIKHLKLRHPVSIGLMYGMGAHVLGMAKALELGELEGSSATLAVITGAVMTVVWAFILLPVILSWMGV